jgi:hypothetical protein
VGVLLSNGFFGGGGPGGGGSGYQYHRLLVTDGNQASQVAIGQIEWHSSIGGANRRKSVSPLTFYSTQSAGNEAEDAFDGTPTAGGWFSQNGAGYPQYMGCEMDAPCDIVEVLIHPYQTFPGYAPKDFKIQGSNDYIAGPWVDEIVETGVTVWNPSTWYTFT